MTILNKETVRAALDRAGRGAPYVTKTDDGTPQNLVMDHDKPVHSHGTRPMADPPDMDAVFQHEYPFGDDMPAGVAPHEHAAQTHDVTPIAEKLDYWQRSSNFARTIQLDGTGLGSIALFEVQSTVFYLVERICVFGINAGRLDLHVGPSFAGFGYQGGIPSLAAATFMQYNPALFLDDNSPLWAVITGGPANGVAIVTAQAMVAAR